MIQRTPDDPAWYRLPGERDLAAQYLLLYEMSLPYGLDLNNQVDISKSATRMTVSLESISSNELLGMEQRAQQWLTENAPHMQSDGASPSVMFAYIGQRNIRSMLTGTTVALVLISLIVGEFSTAGWSGYPPYSELAFSPGVGVDYWILPLVISGVGTTMTGINFIATIHMLRPPGMRWFRMPLLLWALYATAIIQVLATPVLGITLLLLVAERVLGVGIFDPALGGDPVLYQHFFWFYSHPAVYIMILPAMGIMSELISVFSGKHIFGYKFIAYSSIAIAVIELKRGENALVILNKLYKFTKLETTFGMISLALVNGRPRVLPLRDIVVFPHMIVPLFVDAFRRAEDLVLAMEARCYTGGSGRFAMVDNYFTRTLTSLRTPVMDLSPHSVAILRFRSYFQFDELESIHVDISTDGGSAWAGWSNPRRSIRRLSRMR